MYYIINRIENIDGVCKYTPIGYTLSINKVNMINDKYERTLGKFFKDNLLSLENNNIGISTFFDQNNTSYRVCQQTTSIDDMGLNKIIDIKNMI